MKSVWIKYIKFLYVVLIFASNCTSNARVHTRSSIETRMAASVTITLTCDTYISKSYHDKVGSGIIINKYSVLTAYHVVSCISFSGNVLKEYNKLIEMHMGYRTYLMKILRQDMANDLVELVPETGSLDLDLPLLQQPDIYNTGDPVCMMAAYPQVTIMCGAIQAVYDTSVLITIPVIPGNSGAPLYDKFGDLIGIVTGYCPNRSKCGGQAVILDKTIKSWKLFPG